MACRPEDPHFVTSRMILIDHCDLCQFLSVTSRSQFTVMSTKSVGKTSGEDPEVWGSWPPENMQEMSEYVSTLPQDVAFFHSKLLLDNSASFTSSTMKDLCQKCTVKLIFEAPETVWRLDLDLTHIFCHHWVRLVRYQQHRVDNLVILSHWWMDRRHNQHSRMRWYHRTVLSVTYTTANRYVTSF